jgi:hypothetical protein
MISFTIIKASFAARDWQHADISIEIGVCVIDNGQESRGVCRVKGH